VEIAGLDLSEHQIKLFTSLTRLQQGVVMNVERGMAPVQAYYAAGGTAESPRAAHATVSNMLNNDAVLAFRRTLTAGKVNHLIMSREEMRLRLSSIARGQIADLARVEKEFIGYHEETGEEMYRDRLVYEAFDQASPDSVLAINEISRNEHGIKIKMQSSLAAMKQLAELEGMDAPVKTDMTVNGVGVKITATDVVEASKEYMELMGK
jgi:phage terminase small subunit